MNNPYEWPGSTENSNNDGGNNNEEFITPPEEPSLEFKDNVNTNNQIESKIGPGWRKVKKGEIFEPGGEFRLNVSTGETFVKEPDFETSGRINTDEEETNPLENLEPEINNDFNQEYPESDAAKTLSDFTEGWNEFSNTEKQTEEYDLNENVTNFFKNNSRNFWDSAKSISNAFESKDYDKAKNMAWEFVASLRDKAGNYFANNTTEWFEEYDQTVAAAEQEPEESKKDKLEKLAIDGIDFIPVVGSMKMMAESASGKTMGGKQLKSFNRFMHGAEGSVFLAMDLTGMGVAADGLKAAKLMSRSSALMRNIGLSEKVYKPIFKFSEYIGRHPNVAKVADKAIQYMVNRRKDRKVNWARRIPDVILED